MNAGIFKHQRFPDLLRASLAMCLVVVLAGCEPLDFDFGGGGELGGGNIAFIRNGNLLMSEPEGANETYIIRDQGTVEFPAFSPNGQRIAFAYNEAGDASSLGIYVYNRADESLELLAGPLLGTSFTSPSWSPNGNEIVFVETQATGGSRLLSVSSEGGTIQEVPQAPFDLQFPLYRSATELLVLRGAGNEINLLGWGSANPTTLGVRTNSRPAVSADGTQLAYSTADGGGRIVVRNLTTNAEIKLPSSGGGDVNPTFSPLGDVVAFEAGGHVYGVVLDDLVEIDDGVFEFDQDADFHILQNGTQVTWGP